MEDGRRSQGKEEEMRVSVTECLLLCAVQLMINLSLFIGTCPLLPVWCRYLLCSRSPDPLLHQHLTSQLSNPDVWHALLSDRAGTARWGRTLWGELYANTPVTPGEATKLSLYLQKRDKKLIKSSHSLVFGTVLFLLFAQAIDKPWFYFHFGLRICLSEHFIDLKQLLLKGVQRFYELVF